MKHFLFIAAFFVLLSQAVFARVPITIKNNTGCDITVRIRGNVNGTPCTNVYVSAPITIPPLGSVFYNDPTTAWVPGGLNCACTPGSLGVNDPFTAVEILDRGTGCGPATTLGFVGIPCSGFPLVSPPYMVLDGTCLLCGPVSATWNMMNATVTFN